MKRLVSVLLPAALAVALVASSSPAAACEGDCAMKKANHAKSDCDGGKGHDKTAKAEEKAKPAAEKFTLASVAEVSTLVTKKDAKAAIFDANDSEFRAREGVLPGAKLLTSFNEYDVAKELPAAKDTQLVFYCANSRCQASHMAARRAVDAGYAHVAVMGEGLLGWKAAGQKTAVVPGT